MNLKWEFIASSVFFLNLLAFSSVEKNNKDCRKPLIVSQEKSNVDLNHVYEKIIDWIVENKKVPAGFKDWSKVGVNYGKLVGIGSYASGKKSHRLRLHENSQEAFSKILEKIEQSSKFNSLSEKEKSELLLELKIRAGDPQAFAQQIEIIRQDAYEKIIEYILQNKQLPAGGHEWTKIEVNYGKFVGNSDYRPGGESYRSRLHDNPNEAFTKLREKLENSEKFNLFSKEEKNEIILELKIRSGDQDAFAQKISLLREEAYKKVIEYILQNKKIPTGNEWTKMGVNYGKFAGIGDYFSGGESYGSRLHNSPQEAFTKLLKELESSDRLDSLSEKEKTDILVELKIRSGQPNAFTQKIDLIRQEAYQKILQATIENKKIPAGFKEWNKLGVNYGKFVGGSDYKLGGESYSSRLHDGTPEAFQGLYYFAEDSPLFDNKPELKSEILQIIAKRYQDALKRDKRLRPKPL